MEFIYVALFVSESDLNLAILTFDCLVGPYPEVFVDYYAQNWCIVCPFRNGSS